MKTIAIKLPFQAGPLYRWYILSAFVLVYTFNFVDRILISILQEPIRLEFGLSDFQLGLLGGPAFAVLYSLTAIPIARVAERVNRVTVVSIGLAIWSGMTALSGLATSYMQLFVARIGVGVGEASCAPSVHAVVSDYFPPERRASALSVVMLGVPIGTLLAAYGGGYLVESFSWRTAFIVLGVPGVVFALVLWLTVKDPRKATVHSHTGFAEALSAFRARPAFWHLSFAGAFMNFFGYGTSVFLVSHMVRSLNLSVSEASIVFGSAMGFGGIVGLVLGGTLCDRLKSTHPTVEVWLPAIFAAIAIPVYLLAFASSNVWLVGAALFFGMALLKACIGPTFAAIQGIAGPKMRSTAAAVALLVSNLIGYCLGPLFVGVVSDLVAVSLLEGTGVGNGICKDNADAECVSAIADGLRIALLAVTGVLSLAIVHLVLAKRTFQRDFVG